MKNFYNVENVEKYSGKQQKYPVEYLNNGCEAYSGININRRSIHNIYRTDNFPSTISKNKMIKKPLVSYTDSKGFQHRSPEIGRVIPRDEIINRIVPYWEVSPIYVFFFWGSLC